MGINLASYKLEKCPWQSPNYHSIAPLRASQIDDDKRYAAKPSPRNLSSAKAVKRVFAATSACWVRTLRSLLPVAPRPRLATPEGDFVFAKRAVFAPFRLYFALTCAQNSQVLAPWILAMSFVFSNFFASFPLNIK